MKHLSLFLISFVFIGCGSKVKEQQTTEEPQNFPSEIPAIEAIESDQLVLPDAFRYTVLFQEGDSVFENGNYYPSKGNQDLVIYLPTEHSSEKGQLFVSHESKHLNTNLGHGGGASIMNIEQNSGAWTVVGNKENINFSNVGYTMRNCGGKATPYGTILMAEETVPSSVNKLYGHVLEKGEAAPDTLHENFGWIVEVDPKTKKPLRKLTGMGRYSHEDAICLPDNKSVILTNDESPAVLFKFVAEQENDFTKGQLYAYSETGEHWLALPMELDSLKKAKSVAINMGVTLFARMEWGTLVGDVVYLTETGKDSIDWTAAIAAGGVPASHFEALKYEEGKYDDPFGRVVALDLENDSIFIQVAGSKLEDGGTFSNPDCINHFKWNDDYYLIMSEDIIGLSKGRVSEDAYINERGYNEIYIQNLTTKKLSRFACAPLGSETTGLYFTPDYSTLFFSVQHPDTTNELPFNKTSVIAVQGF